MAGQDERRAREHRGGRPVARRSPHAGRGIAPVSGGPAAAAQAIAASLVLAEQLGHASHGLMRVIEYLDAVADGQVRQAETPVVASRAGSTAIVDGRWGWGHLAAGLGARTATEIARDTGVGLVAVRNCNHSGRLGEWVEYIAGNGLVGAGFLSCGPAVAPLGGVERVLGTNPLAVAIPTGDDQRPVVLDFATAGVAEGKIRVAAQASLPAPPGSCRRPTGRRRPILASSTRAARSCPSARTRDTGSVSSSSCLARHWPAEAARMTPGPRLPTAWCCWPFRRPGCGSPLTSPPAWTSAVTGSWPAGQPIPARRC